MKQLGASAAFLFASLLCAQTGPDGHWEGSFAAGDRQIGISLDLARNQKSEWIASMGVPSENVTGLVVTDVTVTGNSVRFVAVELRMAPFDLTLGSDGTMRGTMSGQQGRIPVAFKRTGEAKVALIPPSPAVSKELEGDWEGALTESMRIVFHFTNRPDDTVTATVDSGGAMGLPLNDVKQTGRKVEFGMKIAGAVFQGELNAGGTELAGQLVHEGEGRPLTLRKK